LRVSPAGKDAGGTRHGRRLGARSEHQPTRPATTLSVGLKSAAALSRTQKHRSLATDAEHRRRTRGPDLEPERRSAQRGLRTPRAGRPRRSRTRPRAARKLAGGEHRHRRCERRAATGRDRLASELRDRRRRGADRRRHARALVPPFPGAPALEVGGLPGARRAAGPRAPRQAIAERTRRALAAGLRRTADPEQPPRRFDCCPVLPDRIAAVRIELLQLATDLEQTQQPDPASVALIHELLTAATSPLYNPNRSADDLRDTLARAHARITTQPTG
jgi:hypothetical protein